ncbi:hypothetical protein [Allonocardiopsis opalescens]|uniref:Uncharacterized protein n=1 Tax=Allonocardiopsis opalescens TaxID=1144618 RepID=A0A2T0PTG6_9ACTN|nr:hypothetical protein [Allonocardiopsis opalescens]PRX92016.1 hypothetical protein CLV72_11289 [Allonocardiopsis opalescens]
MDLFDLFTPGILLTAVAGALFGVHGWLSDRYTLTLRPLAVRRRPDAVGTRVRYDGRDAVIAELDDRYSGTWALLQIDDRPEDPEVWVRASEVVGVR